MKLVIWLLIVMILSFIMRPYLPIKKLKLWDEGFALSFGFGFAICFLMAWYISACNICKFGTLICYFSVAFLALLPYVWNLLAVKRTGKKALYFSYSYNVEKIGKMFYGFFLFALIYFAAVWIIGFNPLIDSQTENYMDFGFMQAIYRQQSAIPMDIWFAGKTLNYYFLGQAAAVFLCRLAFVTPEFGYNAMLATFIATVFTSSGEIAYGIVRMIIDENNQSMKDTKWNQMVPYVAGCVASCATALAANGQWLFYGLFEGILNKINHIESTYWYPECTTFISTALGDADNGKTEFPMYSFVLGDLHAHVINVIFVLPFIAILLDYASDSLQCQSNEKNSTSKTLKNIIQIFDIRIIACAILLGLYRGTNFWDFIIYFVVIFVTMLLQEVYEAIKKRRISIKNIALFIIRMLVIYVISLLTTLPFSLLFKKVASQIMLAQNHTSCGKLIVLWGIPVIIVLGLLFFIWLQPGKKSTMPGNLCLGITAISICAIGLVLTPEVLYIKDIYSEADARFNTMFKLTYQAFLIFGILIGISAGLALYESKIKSIYYVKFGVIAFLVLLLDTYTFHAIHDWYGDITNAENRVGISSTATLYQDESYAFEVKAAEIINQDQNQNVNILEGAGTSYTHSSVLSVLTGTCTVCGWEVHEWLWQGDYAPVSERVNQIQNFYEGTDANYCSELLEQYNIKYVFIGKAEREKYKVNEEMISKLGEIVLEDKQNGYMLVKIE